MYELKISHQMGMNISYMYMSIQQQTVRKIRYTIRHLVKYKILRSFFLKKANLLLIQRRDTRHFTHPSQFPLLRENQFQQCDLT